MADVVTSEVRSRMMAGIRGKDTKPEMIVRRALHAMGFRFKLHDRSLPGKPDLVFPKYRTAIFVHGCFWHGHECSLFRWPKSRPQFWREKIGQNKQRDLRICDHLGSMGWNVIKVWECDLRRDSQAEIQSVVENLQNRLNNL